MSDARQQLGRAGEELALEYLVGKGFKPVWRNFRYRGGEIDLIMFDGPVLVFVEVRSKTALDHGSPLDTVNFKKRRQIEKTARFFLAREKIAPEVFCRFDVVGVSISRGQPPKIDHIANAFFTGE